MTTTSNKEKNIHAMQLLLYRRTFNIRNTYALRNKKYEQKNYRKKNKKTEQ